MKTATAALRGTFDDHDSLVQNDPVGKESAPRSRPEDDDRRLLTRVAAKDTQALTLLYQRYAPRIGRFLGKVLKHYDLIEEAVNDTMLVVWRKASEFDPDRALVSTWLFGIARHAGLQALARSANGACSTPATGEERDHAELEHTDNPAATILGWELGRELTAALEQLSPEHRAVIELTFVEGLSYSHIASVMDCPESTVKTRMFYARRRLAQILSHLELESARAYAS
ncbi:MAG: sigma-70 family RNA polymerase sigma factor [Gammaproteobacteria bacterium]|nr:sigma-70 family RNA polymerase sigma factor [Gammaproteobacteria bacterium]